MNISVSEKEVKSHVLSIIRQCVLDEWSPDYVVGIGANGIVPALMISKYLDIPLVTLDVDIISGEFEHNLWIPEDLILGTRVLFVDACNPDNSIINWVYDDMTSCGVSSEGLKHCFTDNNNARFAVLINNVASDSNVSIKYVSEEYNSLDYNVSYTFPWESWWTL